MKVFALTIFVTLTSALFDAASGAECDGEQGDRTITELNFFDSNVITTTLHEVGGELRYEDVGVFKDISLDLVVTVTSGDYTDIASTWENRDKNSDGELNGKNGQFGTINLQTVQGNPKSGEGNFKMCIVEKGTNVPVKLEKFSWSIFDLDWRSEDVEKPNKVAKISVKEKFIIDASQAKEYRLTSSTEIEVSCEDDADTAPNCEQGRTIFHSTTYGTGNDNPADPTAMQQFQQDRSVVFTFQDTSCWQFTYDHYCPVDQFDYSYYNVDNTIIEPETCSNFEDADPYSGGNFLFSGNATQISNDGDCFTPSPTISSSPSHSPTPAPSIPPPACPEDVKIIHMDGITEVDPGQAIRILNQDTQSVTVRLYNGWTSTEEEVDKIFYTYKHDVFSQKCHDATDILGSVNYDDITIQCHHMVAFAELDICVVDVDGALNAEGDNAQIPTCCEPFDGPTVCYKFVIYCESQCDVQARRTLRGAE